MASEEPAIQGRTGPLLRYLVEVLIDLSYLFRGYGDLGSDPSMEEEKAAWQEAAARILVWDTFHWDRVWRLHESVAEADSSLDGGRGQRETPAEAIERTAGLMEAISEDASVLRSVFEEASQRRRRWHWSEKSVEQRLDAIRTRIQGRDDAESWEVVLRMLLALYPSVSAEAHPPPGPQLIVFDHREDGTIEIPDLTKPRTNTAVQAGEVLQVIRTIVETAFQPEEEEEAD